MWALSLGRPAPSAGSLARRRARPKARQSRSPCNTPGETCSPGRSGDPRPCGVPMSPGCILPRRPSPAWLQAAGSSSTSLSPSLSPCPRDVAAEGLAERRNKPGGMQGDRHSMAGRALEGVISAGEGESRAEEPLLAPWGCQDLAPAASSASPYQHLSAIFNYTAQNAASANWGAAGRPPGAGSEQLLLSHRGHLHVPAAWSGVPSPARTPCSTHQGLSALPCLLPGLGRRSRAGGGCTRGSTVPPAPALCPHCSTGQVSLQQQGP